MHRNGVWHDEEIASPLLLQVSLCPLRDACGARRWPSMRQNGAEIKSIIVSAALPELA
jgi:hypothetical protein